MKEAERKKQGRLIKSFTSPALPDIFFSYGISEGFSGESSAAFLSAAQACSHRLPCSAPVSAYSLSAVFT